MIDLRNTREEAICIAGLKSNQEQCSKSSETEWDDQEYWSEEYRRFSASEKSMEQDDEDDRESQYRLDPKYSVSSFKLQSYTKADSLTCIILLGTQMSRLLNVMYERGFTSHQ